MVTANAQEKNIFNEIDFGIKMGTEYLTLKNNTYMCNDRIYVSLRDLCEQLNIPITWNNEKKEVEIDINNKTVPVSNKTNEPLEGIINDEETAIAIGKTILEKHCGRTLEYETEDKNYYLVAKYSEEQNEWAVYQTFDYKDGRLFVVLDKTSRPTVKLNRNTGEVLYLNTYADSLWK